MSKSSEKEKAIQLRREGLSYGEILRKIQVAKSTLSLWLRGVGLARSQVQRLTEKKRESALRGALAVKNFRIQTTERIIRDAAGGVGKISDRELLLIGVALYWAEGSKQKEHNVSQQVIFSNSDPLMVKLFLKWLRSIVGIEERQISFEIYIHEKSGNNTKSVIKYWSDELRVSPARLAAVYFKRGRIKTKRMNVGEGYYGLIRVRVRESTNLNRKITGWAHGICQNCGVV